MKKYIFQILTVSVMGLFLQNAAAADYIDGTAAARISGNQFLSEIGTQDKINARISQPLTSDAASMTTFGPDTIPPEGSGGCPAGYVFESAASTCRKQSFAAQISAPSSENFIDIFINPGPSNDLASLTIRQDTNFDGNLNYTYTSPITVSGICANGIISCDTGTWSNCGYYAWTAGISSRISLGQVPGITSLAGCYCINTSCGSTLAVDNQEQILKDLGGGVVGIIQGGNPQLTISRVENIAPNFKYYGQKTSSAGALYPDSGSTPYYGGAPNPETYYNPTSDTLSGVGISEATAQAGDDSSFFSSLTKTKNQIADAKTIKSCSKNRRVEIDPGDNPHMAIIDTCTSLDTAGCTLYEETLCSYGLNDCVISVKQGIQTGATPSDNLLSLESPYSGAFWTFSATGSTISYSYLSSTGNLSSGPDHWWNIKRKFMCDSGHDINTNDYPMIPPSTSYAGKAGVERASHTRSNALLTGDVMVYEDYDPATGTSIARGVSLQPGDPASPCDKSCKVQLQSTSTEVGTEGKTSDYQHAVDSITTIYKPCDPTDTCDLEPGETLIQDCACTNDFPEAAAAMMMIEKASKDMICSAD